MTIIKILTAAAAATAVAAVATAVKEHNEETEVLDALNEDLGVPEPEVPEPFEAFEPDAPNPEDFMSSLFGDCEIPEAYSKWAKNGERLLRAKAERQALRFERKAARLERRNAKRNDK